VTGFTGAVEFNTDALGAGLVLGVAGAGLYGLLAVSLVLTYRVSHTIGFMHGGIALFGTFFYWWLTAPADPIGGIETRMDPIPGVLVVVSVGALIGTAYGATVTGKLADWPRVRLTTYSLGWLLGLLAAVFTLFQNRIQGAQGFPLPSPFGRSKYQILGAVVTIHQVVTLAILVALIALLSLFMLRTRTGTYVRAIADDPEAGRWAGIPLHRVGTGVYALSGAASAFAGVLLATAVGISVSQVLFVFLRALTVSVLGGLQSLPLALAGCLLLGIGETTLSAELLGPLSTGEREMIIMGALLGLVFLINRFRRVRVIEAASQ